MRVSVLLLLVLAVCSGLSSLSASAAAVSAPVASVWTVNLDDAPETRWVAVVSQFKADLAPIEAFIDSLIPPWLQTVLLPLFENLDNYLPGDYPMELRGVANASGMDLGKVVAMNLIYDFTAFCTSILAQQPNGTMLHSRNLDYDIPGLRNITVDVQFTQGGNVVFTCTTFVGYVGCLTGMRPHGWTVSVDQRMPANESIVDNLIAAFLGGRSLAFHLRDTLYNVSDFDTALADVSTVPLIAPVYIIIGGANGEGAIVTRNQSQAVDVWHLDANAGLWWILETNYDHWLPPPPNDDRRDPANKMMKAIGQDQISNDGMLTVLSTPPVLNSGTQYTTQMTAATGFYQTYVRTDAPPNVPLLR